MKEPAEKKDEQEKDEEEKAEEDKEKDERIKRAIALGTLVMGVYTMDKLLAEEKTIYLPDNKYIKIKKGFLDEFFE
jgi:hypothetical protein